MTARLPLAVTMGEPAGVGGELTLKAWMARDATRPFFAIDDPGRLAALAGALGLAIPVRQIADPNEAAAVFALVARQNDALLTQALELTAPWVDTERGGK